MVLNSILDRLQPNWIVNYHEHDSLLEHVFSEELSEEERKAAWDDYRSQIAQYDNAAYYSALQNQLDEATASVEGRPLQLVVQSSNGLPGGPGMKTEGVGGPNQTQQQTQQQQHANRLLTVLSNTNRNVTNLICFLQEKASLGTQQQDFQHRHIPLPPKLLTKIRVNDRNITAHYALVEQGVKIVNSTLQKCHVGQMYLEPGANKMANHLRSQLIANLDVLRSGSRNPLPTVPQHPVGGGGGGNSGGGPRGQQLLQRAIQVQLPVRLHPHGGGGGGGPS